MASRPPHVTRPFSYRGFCNSFEPHHSSPFPEPCGSLRSSHSTRTVITLHRNIPMFSYSASENNEKSQASGLRLACCRWICAALHRSGNRFTSLVISFRDRWLGNDTEKAASSPSEAERPLTLTNSQTLQVQIFPTGKNQSTVPIHFSVPERCPASHIFLRVEITSRLTTGIS